MVKNTAEMNFNTSEINSDNKKVFARLNGEVTELTEDEIIMLLEYRMAGNEGRREIRKMIEKAKLS